MLARLLAASFILCAFAGSAAAQALPRERPDALGFHPDSLAPITHTLQAYVDSGKLAAVYAVIVRHGKIAYEQTYGSIDVEHRVPLKRDAVYRIYSMTKPVIAVGILKLMEQKKLKLDDPVAKYIPAFGHVKVFAGGTADAPMLRDPAAPMTIRQLLDHTSGLAYGLTSGPVDTLFTRAKLYDAARTTEEFVDSLARIPLLFSPGTAWSYSSGIDVAGRVIEVASGQPLDRFLEQQVFRPLGMTMTSFRKRPDMSGRILTLYERTPQGTMQVSPDGPLQLMFEPDAKFFWGSGGLLSTPDDYLRFTQMLLGGGKFRGTRVLKQKSVEIMTHSNLPAQLTPLPKRSPMRDAGYGFGLAVAVLVDSTLATLPGPAGIYRWSGYLGTYFWNDPRNDLTAMVWTQFNPGSTYPLEPIFQRLVYAALKQ